MSLSSVGAGKFRLHETGEACEDPVSGHGGVKIQGLIFWLVQGGLDRSVKGI